MTENHAISVIGAGLAGCEAAWQAAERGAAVTLHEMKPHRYSPAHMSPDLAELVCSNSFRGESLENAVGLLKEELRLLGSLFMSAADATRVPAGGAVAVDREHFARLITARIETHPRIKLVREEVAGLPPGVVIVASGPLTSDQLTHCLRPLVGENLYFYDAIAPIVHAESIDHTRVFQASRYGKGSGSDYLNCPFNRNEYENFVTEILNGETVSPRDFEKAVHFEGCMPVEELARRGIDTLRFGPMKPVGLTDPRTGREPHAVIQLRQENHIASLYNMVGFQTKLNYGAQCRIFRTIPGLEKAVFTRLGSLHRNTFINAPLLLHSSQQLRNDPRVFFAGQITGVEGYVESAASGYLAGVNAARFVSGKYYVEPPRTTALGSLVNYITSADSGNFQPMNITYGLFPDLEQHVKKNERRSRLAERALRDLGRWRQEIEL